MVRHLVQVGMAALLLSACDQNAPDGQGSAPNYPETAKVEVVDDYHGVKVADPYRWLEDDVRENPQVEAWVEAQNALSQAYLAELPRRQDIEIRLTELWNYERYSAPIKEAGRYFFMKNDGLQNQAVLYVQDGLTEDPRVLIDPNSWSEDGTVALAGFAPSPDGRYLAFARQDGGSDWRVWRFMDLRTGEVLEEELRWIKFAGVSWARDGSGVYYGRYPAPEQGEELQGLNHDMKVWYHAIGSDQSADRLIYERPDHPDWGFASEVTEDGRYLVVTIWKGTDNRYRVVYFDLAEDELQPVDLITTFESDFSFIANDGDRFFFFTDKEAPKGRIVAIDLAAPDRLTEIVPEQEHVLVTAPMIGDRFVAEYLEDAKSVVRLYNKDGSPAGTVDLPGIGSVGAITGAPGDPEMFFDFSSFNAPPTIYRYNTASLERGLFRRAEVDFEPDAYTVTQRFYTSKDGTRVPMFLAHKKSLDMSQPQSTLLYGYGGFNISLTPSFSITRLAWMEMGGVYAVANLRGGGEYGKDWHKAGTKLNKQNVFDDFIAAAEYLIDERITTSDRLGIFGGSNGGLLVGAVLNQRPDLFGAAMPAVGVMDMLRFHKFTAGRFWVDDYGSADQPDEFQALYAYSPYHNIQDGVAFPPVLITTADRDDRVVPGHSFKYAARLQAAQSGEAPILIRIETRAGHGAGTSTQKAIEEYADRWAFLAKHLGLTGAES
ncbi:MAG: prolyl oligopeptidase family protein [Rhodothalassiaceae bacterium]